jgi:hypothetical protein
VAVLNTNMAPNMGQFLPPSVNAAFLDTKMVPSIRHGMLSDVISVFRNGE